MSRRRDKAGQGCYPVSISSCEATWKPSGSAGSRTGRSGMSRGRGRRHPSRIKAALTGKSDRRG